MSVGWRSARGRWCWSGSLDASPAAGGQLRLLGLARALINDPDVLLLDDPTKGLEPATCEQVLAVLRDVGRRRGITVVLSARFWSEVDGFCDAELAFDRGKLVAAGTGKDQATN
jgi:D-methionine transport system ATP-binding protein